MSGNRAQPSAAHPQTRANKLYQFSLAHPILVPLALLFIAVIFRILDIVVFRLDEVWGEAILHKALGFALVVLYLWAAGKSIAEIGLHGRLAGKAMLIAAIGTTAILIIGFGLQLAVSRGAGKQPMLIVAAIDSKEGVSGGLLFALFLIVGNVVNSSMEDGLFRGVMLRHFRVRLSPWQANLLQAALFAAWHLVRPVKHLLIGETTLASAAAEGATILLGSGITGFAWGYMYLKTDNLWAPWLAHVINNSALNLLHIRTVDGLDTDTAVLYGVIAFGYLALLVWTRFWTKRLQMPQVSPWGVPTQAEKL